MIRFTALIQDRTLGIGRSELTSLNQGGFIPVQILQAYYDEDLPFVLQAPITRMRVNTFLGKLDMLIQEHPNPAVRGLAEWVRDDVSKALSGFDPVGKRHPRKWHGPRATPKITNDQFEKRRAA